MNCAHKSYKVRKYTTNDFQFSSNFTRSNTLSITKNKQTQLAVLSHGSYTNQKRSFRDAAMFLFSDFLSSCFALAFGRHVVSCSAKKSGARRNRVGNLGRRRPATRVEIFLKKREFPSSPLRLSPNIKMSKSENDETVKEVQ